jgi:hypothetical protein
MLGKGFVIGELIDDEPVRIAHTVEGVRVGRDVVLSLAGNDTGAAARAFVYIDDHAPFDVKMVMYAH